MDKNLSSDGVRFYRLWVHTTLTMQEAWFKALYQCQLVWHWFSLSRTEPGFRDVSLKYTESRRFPHFPVRRRWSVNCLIPKIILLSTNQGMAILARLAKEVVSSPGPISLFLWHDALTQDSVSYIQKHSACFSGLFFMDVLFAALVCWSHAVTQKWRMETPPLETYSNLNYLERKREILENSVWTSHCLILEVNHIFSAYILLDKTSHRAQSTCKFGNYSGLMRIFSEQTVVPSATATKWGSLHEIEFQKPANLRASMSSRDFLGNRCNKAKCWAKWHLEAWVKQQAEGQMDGRR